MSTEVLRDKKKENVDKHTLSAHHQFVHLKGNHCFASITSYLAGTAAPVGEETGPEMVVGVRVPTPTAEAAETVECPVQSRQDMYLLERARVYLFTRSFSVIILFLISHPFTHSTLVV